MCLCLCMYVHRPELINHVALMDWPWNYQGRDALLPASPTDLGIIHQRMAVTNQTISDRATHHHSKPSLLIRSLPVNERYHPLDVFLLPYATMQDKPIWHNLYCIKFFIILLSSIQKYFSFN